MRPLVAGCVRTSLAAIGRLSARAENRRAHPPPQARAFEVFIHRLTGAEIQGLADERGIVFLGDQ